MSYINNSFSLNEDYYFCNFLDNLGMQKTKSSKMMYVVENFHRVAAIILTGAGITIIKESKERPFVENSIKNMNALAAPFMCFYFTKIDKDGNEKETKIGGNDLSDFAIEQCGIYTYSSVNNTPLHISRAFNTFRPLIGSQNRIPFLSMETLEEKLEPWFIIMKILCDEDPIVYEHFLNWLSWIIQNPGKASGIMYLIHSLPGMGKGTFTEFMTEFVFGLHCTIQEGDFQELMGTFNGPLEGKMFTVFNELPMTTKEFHPYNEKLKKAITGKMGPVRKMYKESYEACNYNNFLAATNNKRCGIKVEQNDRRIVCVSVRDSLLKSLEFYEDHHIRYNNVEYGSYMYEYLSRREITGKIRHIPMTKYKQYLIGTHSSPSKSFIREQLLNNKANFKTALKIYFGGIKGEKNYDNLTTRTEIKTQYKLWCSNESEKYDMKEINTIIPDDLEMKFNYVNDNGTRSTKKCFDIDELIKYWYNKHIIIKEDYDDDA
jgi:hypothetical protein